MERDERGYIVIETIGSFLLLVLLMTAILTMVNVVVLQARIHYALSQTAQTISMYSYTLEKLGLIDHLINSENQAQAAQTDIDEFMSNMDMLVEAVNELSIDKGKTGVQGFYDQAQGLKQKGIKAIFQEFLNYGLHVGKGYLFQEVLRALMDRYLSSDVLSGDDYLLRFGIMNDRGEIKGTDSLTFYDFKWDNVTDGSNFINSKGEIVINVVYYIDYRFGALPLPFTRMRITQQAITKSWSGGHGEGYKG